ncbi:MAG: SUMF1/EgtB/PvdO family nonheme iron enzyme [Anaerolineales bacterium]|jgi:formylglycine-generating enzyme required for sulfatase activity
MEIENLTIDGMGFVWVPKGGFTMGSREDDELAFGDEFPQHRVDIPYDYWTGRYPVTKREFGAFVRATSHLTRGEKEGWCWVWNRLDDQWEKVEGAMWEFPDGDRSSDNNLGDHPVVQVCWYDARAYCGWLNETRGDELPEGYCFSLPSEAEWEKAARGPEGREWTWGNEFDPAICHYYDSGQAGTIPIGSHSPQSDSVYGAADMSGNVWEWTITLWGEVRDKATYVYPYDSKDGRESLSAEDTTYRIIRGGSFKNEMRAVRCACRDLDPQNYSLNNLGFRVFVTPVRE